MVRKFKNEYYQELFEERSGKYLELMTVREADERAYKETYQQIIEDLKNGKIKE